MAKGHRIEEHFGSPHHFVPEDILVLQFPEVHSQYTQIAAASL